jgi:hypothetical protein
MKEEYKLEISENLEDSLGKHENNLFPNFSPNRGEKPYIERYNELKNVLQPIHNAVEKGAMAKSAIEYVNKIKETIGENDNEENIRLTKWLIDSDPIVYLNNHGLGHVEKVIEKTSEILHYFDHGHLTPYEVFILLCAIQIHDVGNLFGRDGHEISCGKVLYKYGKPFIQDAFERSPIEKLALVHGGEYSNDKDKLKYLSESKTLRDHKVRKRLLAALLRFGDELADDSSRCDRVALEENILPEQSIIYHQYSQALHTVKLEKDEYGRLQVHLSFEIDSDIAIIEFKKYEGYKYLLDEIYDRTLKMERERRYCMRYLKPFIYIDAIRVEIVIQNSQNAMLNHTIQYTLTENSYPDQPYSGEIKTFRNDIRNGKEECAYLKSEWRLK